MTIFSHFIILYDKKSKNNNNKKNAISSLKCFWFFIFKSFLYNIINLLTMNHRFQLENLSLKKGIEDSRGKTSKSLAETLLLNEILTKKELYIIAKNLNIKKPHKLSSNSLISHFKRFLTIKKLEDLGFNKLSKRYISLNELQRVQKLNDLSFDTLKN